MQFTIHTGLKQTLFELHHGRKPRTESTNLVKDSKSFLSDWTELSVSAEKKNKNLNLWFEKRRRGYNKLPGNGKTKFG